MLGFPLVAESIRMATAFTRRKLNLKQFDEEAQGCAQFIEWVIWLVVGYHLWSRIP